MANQDHIWGGKKLDRLTLHPAKCILLLATAVVVSGCNISSTLPSRNLDPLLSEAQNAQPSSELDDKAAPSTETAASQTTTKTDEAAKKTKLSPAVESALVPAKQTESPSQAATSQVATTPPSATAKVTAAPQAASPPETPVTAAETTPKPPATSRSRRVVSNSASERGGNPTVRRSTSQRPRSGGFFASLSRPSAASARTAAPRPTVKVTTNKRSRAAARRSSKGLPGVSLKRLFGIDDKDTEELDEPVRVAGVANLARRGTHGLLLQRPGVQVGCFPRKLVGILKKAERRFGRTPIVTSGYRSPAHNRRIRGARKSTHISCKAADIQIQGVSKWKLAKYLRSLPEVGGVGTYCHTKSVHVDIGKKRAWNRRCGKRRRRS